MPVLKPRHEKFCQHFVLDPNATRAAMAAGYSPHTARQQGSRLLRRQRLVERIAAIRRDMAREHCHDLGTLMGKLEALYRRAMEDHAFTAAARRDRTAGQVRGLIPAPGKAVTDAQRPEMSATRRP